MALDVKSTVFESAILIFNCKNQELSEFSSAKQIPAWDSLSNIKFIIEVERRLSITFSSHEVIGLNDLGEMIALCERKLDSTT